MATGPRPRHIWRVVLVVVVLLIAGNLMVAAARQHGGDVVANLPTDVVQVLPEPQQVIRPQDTVGAQLRGGLQAVLRINGGQIPEDQISGDPGLGQIQFRPGCNGTGVSRTDCQYQEFDPGTINLRVEWWPQGETFETAHLKHDIKSYGWQATVG